MTQNSNHTVRQASEVASVRNLIFAIEYGKNQKKYNLAFHILYALLCALSFGVSLLVPGTAGFIFSIIAPAMYVYTLLSSPAVVRALPPALPLAAYAVMCLIDGKAQSFSAVSADLIAFTASVVAGVFIALGVIMGHTKIRQLITVTVVLVFAFLVTGITDMIYETGSFSVKGAVEALDENFSAAVDEYVNTANTIIDDETFEKIVAEVNSETPITREELLDVVGEMAKMTFFAIKLSLPSIVILGLLFKAFLIMEVFSVFVRILKINVYVCIADKFWTYRMPMISVKLYEVILTVFIITSFFNISTSFSAAILNILIILTPPMLLWGIRGIYQFLASRSMPKIAAIILTAILIAVLFTLLNVWSVFLLGSIGVTTLTLRNMKELENLPRMMAENADFAENYRRSLQNEAPHDGTKNEETHHNGEEKDGDGNPPV